MLIILFFYSKTCFGTAVVVFYYNIVISCRKIVYRYHINKSERCVGCRTIHDVSVFVLNSDVQFSAAFTFIPNTKTIIVSNNFFIKIKFEILRKSRAYNNVLRDAYMPFPSLFDADEKFLALNTLLINGL